MMRLKMWLQRNGEDDDDGMHLQQKLLSDTDWWFKPTQQVTVPKSFVDVVVASLFDSDITE